MPETDSDADKRPKQATPDPISPDPITPDREIGGRKGPEPTRYGDWEKNGIISDF